MSFHSPRLLFTLISAVSSPSIQDVLLFREWVYFSISQLILPFTQIVVRWKNNRDVSGPIHEPFTFPFVVSCSWDEVYDNSDKSIGDGMRRQH